MYKTFGGAGPTWFMEGMAEVAGTHSWDGKSLQLGIVPLQAEAVPYWGRTKIIKESRKAGAMPSLESVMRIKGSARMDVESYAWCWAAATFFRNHPVGKEGLAKVLSNKLDYSNKLNAELQDSMPKSDWNRLKAEWEGFVAEVDMDMTWRDPCPCSRENCIGSIATLDKSKLGQTRDGNRPACSLAAGIA